VNLNREVIIPVYYQPCLSNIQSCHAIVNFFLQLSALSISNIYVMV